MMALLIDFFTKGTLGSIALGDSREAVRAKLGSPEEVSVSKKPDIWKYGCLQLSFARGATREQSSVDFIGVYFSESPCRLPESVLPADWFPDRNTTPDQFNQYLAAHAMALEANPTTTFETQLGFRVAGRGCVVFGLTPRGLALATIQVSNDHNYSRTSS